MTDDPMTDHPAIRENDIVTSQTAPAGIVIPPQILDIYKVIKDSPFGEDLKGAYLAGSMFEDLKTGAIPYHIRMGLVHRTLAQNLNKALKAKLAPASSYSEIRDHDELVQSVDYWVQRQDLPFKLSLTDLFCNKAVSNDVPHCQVSGLFEGGSQLQAINFTFSESMLSPCDIIRIHSDRPTSAIVYDFDRAVYHFHRETEKNMYLRDPSGFTPAEKTAVEKAAALGIRVVK